MLGHSCQTSTVIIFDLHLPFFLSVLFSFLFSAPLLFQPYLVALDHLLLGHQFSDCLAFLFLCVFLSWVSFYFIVFCDLSISILNFWSLVWKSFTDLLCTLSLPITTQYELITVMVHFVGQFDWAQGCPEAGKTLFLGVSVRALPEEVRI